MLMMKIEMNADKIQAEQRYTMSAINRTIESAFAQMQLRKVVNTLKKQPWFMENVSVWRLYDSEDSDNLNDCSEEDLLLHYRRKQQVGG